MSPERIDRLRKWKHFDEIIHSLLSASVESFWWELFREDRLKGCHRASYTLSVAPYIYDAFFSAPIGYRAQYALSASNGCAANRKLLDALKSKLLNARSKGTDIDKTLVSTSLEGVQAKIWVDETEVDVELSDPVAAIMYEPWERASLDGQGLRAPVGRTLEVKGAWVDGRGYERSDPRKARRNSQISEVGFS